MQAEVTLDQTVSFTKKLHYRACDEPSSSQLALNIQISETITNADPQRLRCHLYTMKGKKNLSKRNLSDHKLLWALSRLYTLEHSQIFEEKNDRADEKV